MNGIFLENISKNELFSYVSAEISKSIENAGIDLLVSTSEAAKILDCSESTVRNKHRAGILQNMSPGGHEKWSLRQIIRLRREKTL